MYETRETLSDAGADVCVGRLFTAGTLLFSFKLSIGRMAFAGRDLYTNEAIVGITAPTDGEIDLEYLRYALSMVDYDELVGHAVKGRTLNRKTLKLIEFPLPAMPVQRRVVEALERQHAATDRARAAVQAQLDALDALPAALLRLAFAP